MKESTKLKISNSVKKYYQINDHLLPFGGKRKNSRNCFCLDCKKKLRVRKRKYGLCRECLEKSDYKKIINKKVSKTSILRKSHSGKNNAMYGKVPKFKSNLSHYSTKLKRKIKCRSSYEIRAFQILDLDVNVKSYEYEKIRIPYKRNGVNRTLIVDLLIHYKNDQLKLVEIKPKNFFKMWDNPYKFKIAKNYAKKNNLKFEIWSEKELGIKRKS